MLEPVGIYGKRNKKTRRGRCNKKNKPILTVVGLQHVLSKIVFDDELIIKDMEMSRLFPDADFAQKLYKIEAKIKRNAKAPEEMLYLIAKLMPSTDPSDVQEEDSAEMFQSREREMYFYDAISRSYDMIEDEFKITQNTNCRLFPKFYGYRLSREKELTGIDDVGLLLLENLCARGFYSVDSFAGLDLEHARVAIKTLARYHAVGMVVKDESDDILSYDVEDYDFSMVNVEGLTKILIKDPHLRKNAFRLKTQLNECYDQYGRNMPGHSLLTIAHGNFAGIRNMLFHRNENGEVDGMSFVDFQDYLLASPFRDLSAFIFSCLSLDVMQKRIDELLKLYYDEYVGYIKKLHVNIGTFNRSIFEDRLRWDAILEFPVCAFMYSDDLERLRKIVSLYTYKKWFKL